MRLSSLPSVRAAGRATLPLLLIASPAFAQSVGQELYVHGQNGDIFRVDDYATNPTPVHVASPGFSLTDIAFDPATGLMYSVKFTGGSLFHTYDANFNPTLVGNEPAFTGNALEFGGDGTLWARDSSFPGLWTVDPATGVGTFVATMPATSDGDIAVDSKGRVFTSNSHQEIDVYDPATGSVSSLGPHGLGPWIYGLEMDLDGTLYAIQRYGDVYTIDRSTMSATLVGNLGIEIAGCSFVLPIVPDRPIGSGYCGPAVTNSTGQPGVIAATGSTLVTDNNVTLIASDLPPNRFGFFLTSQTQDFVANPGGSQGNLCLGGAIGRYIDQVASTGPFGALVIDLDLTNMPTPTGPVAVQPGETWNFTAWFRDKNPTATSNFTDAVSLGFQ